VNIGELKNPKSGEVKVIEIDEQIAQQIQNSLSPGTTKSKLHDAIDKFNISAEGKALLFSLADLTIKVGNAAVYLGQKMLELVAYFVKQYPKTTLGLVVGAVIALSISSIPRNIVLLLHAFVTKPPSTSTSSLRCPSMRVIGSIAIFVIIILLQKIITRAVSLLPVLVPETKVESGQQHQR